MHGKSNRVPIWELKLKSLSVSNRKQNCFVSRKEQLIFSVSNREFSLIYFGGTANGHALAREDPKAREFAKENQL